jgi:predicted enzyme related to lactoylglutathione lyase
MAARKSSRNRSARRPASSTRRTRKPARRPARAAARKMKSPDRRKRNNPETLRLRSTTPGLTVASLDQSLQFYTGVLRFFVKERWTDEGGVLRGVMLQAGVCELGLSQDDWKKGRDRKKGEGVRIWFETAQDVDAMAARIKAAGHALTEEPADYPWGRAFSLDDLDGYHLTISRS